MNKRDIRKKETNEIEETKEKEIYLLNEMLNQITETYKEEDEYIKIQHIDEWLLFERKRTYNDITNTCFDIVTIEPKVNLQSTMKLSMKSSNSSLSSKATLPKSISASMKKSKDMGNTQRNSTNETSEKTIPQKANSKRVRIGIVEEEIPFEL